MKMTDLRAKARAIFGPAIAEPMPKQPNGAKALQERANARPIPTYKVGGVVKKPATPPGPTPAEREADRKRREDMAKSKVMQSEADTLGRAMRSEGPRYKDGGKVQTSADTAKKLATEMGGMKKGGAMKPVDKSKNPGLDKLPTDVRNKMGYMKKGGKAKDGLAVMIAIGKPVKEKATGEMYSSKKAMAKHEAAESAGMERMERMKRVKKMDGGEIPTDKLASKLMAVGGAGKTRKGQAPAKFAQGGAGKVRKGMMTPEGKITNAMNKIRGC